jgi:hypothetical protein
MDSEFFLFNTGSLRSYLGGVDHRLPPGVTPCCPKSVWNPGDAILLQLFLIYFEQASLKWQNAGKRVGLNV